MIKEVWNKYEQLVLYYARDIDNEVKHIIANLLTIIVFLIIFSIIFILIFDSDWYGGVILISIGFGRLFLAFIMEKNNCNFGEGYTLPLRLIAESSLMLVTFAVTFALIKNTYENQTVTNSIGVTAKSVALKVKDTNTSNKKTLPFSQNNILNFTETANKNKLHPYK